MIRQVLSSVQPQKTQGLYLVSQFFKVSYIEQPKLRLRTCVPVFPPPGLALEVPEWAPELYLKRIGGGTSEYADKFETIQEIFTLTSSEMHEKGVPPKARRYILNAKEQLRRGVLTFEYLQRRTSLEITKKK